MLALRSTHVHAVSVSRAVCPPQLGGHQSAGHPDHADGVIVGGPAGGASSGSMVSPCGSPGVRVGGPTVPGATVAGSLPLGSSSGGRIERENQPTRDTVPHHSANPEFKFSAWLPILLAGDAHPGVPGPPRTGEAARETDLPYRRA